MPYQVGDLPCPHCGVDVHYDDADFDDRPCPHCQKPIQLQWDEFTTEDDVYSSYWLEKARETPKGQPVEPPIQHMQFTMTVTHHDPISAEELRAQASRDKGMKPMNTTELEAGPELDALVAEALGISLDPVDFPGVCVVPGPAAYSTDLNAAWKAAERVGLFNHTNDRCEIMLSNRYGEWLVREIEWDGCEGVDGRDFPPAPTPALAICRAILKLKADPTAALVKSPPPSDTT